MATLEMGDQYLKKLLGFLGITDYTTLAAENLDIIGVNVQAIVETAERKARELAAKF
ncbi:hypothetical protein SDC9_138937 [bioreactor metagenome]|uniref:Uncharacterized protein n=1 Tax=bioreactor metagenome TaxID=1076179 RepID=A0A645DT87_9ZZZZ